MAWEKASGTGKLPRGLLGSGEVRSTRFGDHGGSGQRSSPVGAVWAVPVLGFAGKGPGNTRKTRLALGYALCGLVRSAEGFAAARRC